MYKHRKGGCALKVPGPTPSVRHCSIIPQLVTLVARKSNCGAPADVMATSRPSGWYVPTRYWQKARPALGLARSSAATVAGPASGPGKKVGRSRRWMRSDTAAAGG